MYYFLRQNIFDAKNSIEITGHTEATGEQNWTVGRPFSKSLSVQELTLDSRYGEEYPDFFDTTIPVMSQKLLSFLVSLGVSNIDSYAVNLKDRATTYQGYYAVNVIGVIDGVDLNDSEYRLRFNKPYFTGKVVIDENKVKGARLFRLLHGPGLIVISQDIADELMKHEWSAIMLQPTEDYEGT
ncbi:MAG: hypothetical protein P8Z77_00640 [Candidatus Thiodiazotropha sp.]